MIVCSCKRVCHRKINAAIEGGATTVEAVGRSCRAGTGCGACHEQIQEMIDASASDIASCDLGRPAVLSPAYLSPGKAA